MARGDPSAPGGESDLRAVLDAAGVGTFTYDVSTGVVAADRLMRAAFGLGDEQAVVPAEALFAAVHPEDLPMVQAEIARAEREHGHYSVEHRILLPEGERWLDVHGHIVEDEGGGVCILGTVRDSTELRSARDEVARVLDQLAEAFVALDLDDRLTYANSAAAELLGRDQQALVGLRFWAEAPALLGERFGVLGRVGPTGGKPLVVEDFSETLGIWLELRIAARPGGTAVYLSDVTTRRAVADRTRRLQQIAAALARALTPGDVARVALEHATSGVSADSAGVLLIDEDRREMRLEAGLDELTPAVRERWSRLSLSAATPINLALDTGYPQLLSAEEAVAGWPHLARDVQALQAGYYALFPLVTAGTPLGLLALGWKARGRLDDDELAFLAAVSAQCAQALERAELFDQQRRIAESLQKSLLPQQLPDVEHVDLGARYLAGAAGLQVGGDWYDVLPLPDGRVAVALGDVVGKGLPAAAAMGQVRYALRAYAVRDPAPAAVLSCLDDFFAVRDDEEIVTLVYGVLDPADGVLIWSNAGHPPPLLVGADSPRTLTGRSDGTPLGVRSPRQEATVQLAPGEMLLLYSDGLVESRTRPVGDGLTALLEVARDETSTGASLTAEMLVADVLAAMLGPHDAEDDATLLALRWLGPAGERRTPIADGRTTPAPYEATTRLRPEALASSSARHFLRSLLARWELAELSDVAELCVSELVTNAVLHARTPIEVDVRAGAGVLHVDVCDNGGARIDLPPREEPGEALESGRGLYIVQALSTRTGVQATRHGTCVWFELALPSGADDPGERSERADLG